MLEMNIGDLKKHVDVLTSLIKEYEEIQLNLFAQLKESCENWQDGSSVEFDGKLYLEKNEANLLLEMIKSKRDAYRFITDKYSELGKNIRCNLNNKETVFNAIDHCVDQANVIINDLNHIDNSFHYSEYQMIMSQRRKLVESKKDLLETRRIIAKLYEKIESIEQDVQAKISELEEIKINPFDFKLG